MVAHLLRLRFALLVAALRPGARDRGRALAGTLLLLAGAALAWTGLLAMRDSTDLAVQVVTVMGGSAIALGFLLAPPIAGGGDQLDPRRFVPFGVSSRALASGALVAGLVSAPVLSLAAVAAAVAVVWIPRAGAVSAVAGPVLGLLTAMLLSHVSAALATLLLRERRSRELTGLFLLLLLVVVVPVGVFLASLDWGSAVPSALAVAVSVLSFTPVGAAWALPGYAATGDPLGWVSLVVALLTIGGLGVAWFALVDRILHVTERPAAARVRGGMSWFAVMPGTASGSVAARSLIYWTRDRRYTVNVLIVPVAAILTTVPLLVSGVPPELVALAPLPVLALFLGWLPHNDLAYDSTALWLHVASGVRGIADRFGRLVPLLLLAVPAFAVAIPLCVALNGRWAHIPALIGVCAALFLSGLGLSSIASVVAPYAVTRPGDSPFQQPQRNGGAGIAAQALVMAGACAVSLPTLWWAWLAITREPSWGLAALVAGVGTGLVVLGIGLAIGSAVFERRGGALMEFAEAVA